MRRFVIAIRRLARSAPSVSALAFVGLGAPYATQRLFALEHEPARGRLAALAMAWLATTCAAGLSTLVLGARRKGVGAWGYTMLVPLAMLLVGVVVIAARAIESTLGVYYVLRDVLTDAPLATLPSMVGLVVLADTIRRPRLADRDFAVRVARSAVLLFVAPLAAVVVERPFEMACFSGTLPAEGSAFLALEANTRSAAIHGTAALLVLGLVADRARRRRTRATVLPLAALGLWLLGASFVDCMGMRAAQLVAPGSSSDPNAPIDAHALEAHAIAATIVGGTFATLAVAAWSFAATIAGFRVPRATVGIGWRVVAPIVPAVLLASSGLTDSPLRFRFPQQLPRAAWTDVAGFQPLTRVGRQAHASVPFFRTDGEAMVVALLTIEAGLEVFRNGRHDSMGHMTDFIAPPHNHFWTDAVHVMPDARATFGQLQSSMRALRRFDSIALVWRCEDLDDASRARERWAFAEMGGRSLRSRTFELLDLPAECDATGPTPPAGLHGRWCRRPEGGRPVVDPSRPVFVAEEPDDVVLREWLDALEGLDGEVVLRAPRREWPDERDALDPSTPLPPDEVFHRLALHESPWALMAGAIAGMALAIVILAARTSGSSWASTPLAWLRIEARSEALPSDGGPYRTRKHDEAPRETIALGRQCARAGRRGLDVARQWVFAAVVVAGATIAVGLFG